MVVVDDDVEVVVAGVVAGQVDDLGDLTCALI